MGFKTSFCGCSGHSAPRSWATTEVNGAKPLGIPSLLLLPTTASFQRTYRRLYSLSHPDNLQTFSDTYRCSPDAALHEPPVDAIESTESTRSGFRRGRPPECTEK
eukprot:1372829-Amorphochlora_amoeboformis.AAC.2